MSQVGAGSIRIQLSDGKETVPPRWMSCNELSDYGVSTRQRKRRKLDEVPPIHSYVAPAVTASNLRDKKVAAQSSMNPPASGEARGHMNYLSEGGLRLVIGEIDDCVEHSLSYSGVLLDGEKSVDMDEEKSVEGAAGRAIRMSHLDFASNVVEGGKPVFRTLSQEVHSFLDMFQREEDEDADETTGETAPTVESGDGWEHFSPNTYDHATLPVAIVRCYPNVLDRSILTSRLQLDLSRRKQRSKSSSDNAKSACVCRLQSTSILVRENLLLTEILNQCISNDPNGKAFVNQLQTERRRRENSIFRSAWNWSESLVDWCVSTEAFDSIIVLLEDAENIPSHALGSFLAACVSLRKDFGIPISLVFVDISPGGLDNTLSNLASTALNDSLVHELCVPLPQAQLNLFVNRLFERKSLPTFLWTNRALWNGILKTFQDVDNSIVGVGRRLKGELRRHFSVPGAFISLLNSSHFCIKNRDRLIWLNGEDTCRKMIETHQAYVASESSIRANKCHVDFLWRTSLFSICHQLRQKINNVFNLSPSVNIKDVNIIQFHLHSRMRQLLSVFANVRQKFALQRCELDLILDSKYKEFAKSINEYIIMLGNFAFSNQSASFPNVPRDLIADVISWTEDYFTLQVKLERDLPVQPRRDIARSFVTLPPVAPETSFLAHARPVAFQEFQSRVTTLAEWHGRYFDTVAGQADLRDSSISNEAAFFFAVHELVQCGFIRKQSLTRRKELMYEKVAMLWGSGR